MYSWRKYIPLLSGTIILVLLINIYYQAQHTDLKRIQPGSDRQYNPSIYNADDYIIPQGIRLIPPWKNYMIDANEPTHKAEESYRSVVTSIEAECTKTVRIGSSRDGGWDACLVGQYDLKPPCIVYDFGIAQLWGFDDKISTEYGCHVRAFDPTNGLAEHLRSDKIHFYPIGLHGKDGVTTVVSNQLNQFVVNVSTFRTLLRRFEEEEKIIDYLKIDIEQSEWAALETMIKDGSLRYVKQLGMEAHHSPKLSPPPDIPRFTNLLSGLQALGFRKWKYTPNRVCLPKAGALSHCNEINFINVNFLRK